MSGERLDSGRRINTRTILTILLPFAYDAIVFTSIQKVLLL